MMALVNNQMPIIANNVIYDNFSAKALNEGHVYYSSWIALSSTNLTDLFWIEIEEVA